MSKKIAIIGHGIVGQAFEKMVKDHYQVITYDPAENDTYPEKEINEVDLAVICVPTNESPDGSCDTTIVESAVSKIKGPLILIKSTVEPGTTDRLSKKYRVPVCFSPEYIGESKYYHPYWVDMVETPFFIFGGDEKNTNKLIELIEPIAGPAKQYYQCSALEAEIIKYMENSFFAAKVTFVNEFYDICQAFGANWHKVREGWLMDSRINRMHTSVFPENRGFGGKCYPKDVAAIVSASTKAGFKPTLLDQVQKSNTEFRKKNAK